MKTLKQLNEYFEIAKQALEQAHINQDNFRITETEHILSEKWYSQQELNDLKRFRR